MENIIINDSNLNNNEIQKIGNKVRAVLLSDNKIKIDKSGDANEEINLNIDNKEENEKNEEEGNETKNNEDSNVDKSKIKKNEPEQNKVNILLYRIGQTLNILNQIELFKSILNLFLIRYMETKI